MNILEEQYIRIYGEINSDLNVFYNKERIYIASITGF